jgi:hypothetical protein
MIIPGLYLGCRKTAIDSDRLTQLGIKCVLNVAKELCISPKSSLPLSHEDSHDISIPVQLPLTPPREKQFEEYVDTSERKIKYFEFNWTHTQDFETGFEEAIEIIEKCQQSNTPILVHCYMGVCRSATLVIGYIMKSKQISFKDAYKLVKEKADAISPNVYLCSNLIEYENKLEI